VPAYFFDSSGLVKRYIAETGTAWVVGLADPAAGNDLYLAAVAGVEVVSALVRRSRGGSLPAADAATALSQFRYDFAHQYQIVGITDALLARAMALAETHALRAYDSVQLAAVMELNTERVNMRLPALTLVSADQELNTAAVAEGVSADDPNAHP
jgi:predicted nucleic acid-binding protein